MVHFLTLAEGSGHVANFRRHFGRRAARSLSESTYGEFLGRKEAISGVYIFADRNRMNPVQLRLACRLWDALSVYPDGIKLLNNPHRQMGRYQLLKALAKRGHNDFEVWRLEELPDPVPYPVFVRKENDHGGPRSGLLESDAQLWRALGAMAFEGIDREDMLVCQYQETKDSDGVYRKYGAMRVGDLVYGQFVLLERRWEKSLGERIRSEEAREENVRYFQTNPHEALIRPLFDLAGVEYGRIDYAFANGRIQVWEVNDNPFVAMRVLSHYIMETGVAPYLEGMDHLQKSVRRSDAFPLDILWGERNSAEGG